MLTALFWIEIIFQVRIKAGHILCGREFGDDSLQVASYEIGSCGEIAGQFKFILSQLPRGADRQ